MQHGDLRIHHECEVGIDKSVPRITNWNHEACQVMANGDAEVQQFSIPFSHNKWILFFLLTIKVNKGAKIRNRYNQVPPRIPMGKRQTHS